MTATTRHGRSRGLTLFAAGVAGLAVLFALYKFTLGRPVLVGEDFHDFGTVYYRVSERVARAEHTFTLTNRTGSPIHINSVQTSCGCTTATRGAEIVQPGQTLELDVTLQIRANGLSKQTVSIVMAEHGVRTLTVQGVGRRVEQLRASRSAIDIAPGERQVMTLFMDIWPDDLPSENAIPSISLESGPGLDMSLIGWAQRQEYDAARRKPANWRGQVEITADETFDEESWVEVRIDPEYEIRVPVNGAKRSSSHRTGPARGIPAGQAPGGR